MCHHTTMTELGNTSRCATAVCTCEPQIRLHRARSISFYSTDEPVMLCLDPRSQILPGNERLSAGKSIPTTRNSKFYCRRHIPSTPARRVSPCVKLDSQSGHADVGTKEESRHVVSAKPHPYLLVQCMSRKGVWMAGSTASTPSIDHTGWNEALRCWASFPLTSMSQIISRKEGNTCEVLYRDRKSFR